MEKVRFPLSYYFFGFCWIKMNSKSRYNSSKMEQFYKSFYLYIYIIDISSYINFYKQFELFKQVILKKLKFEQEEINKKKFSSNNLIFNNKLSDKYNKKNSC